MYLQDTLLRRYHTAVTHANHRLRISLPATGSAIEGVADDL